MHLAYILLMALFLWKFSAADLHWCSHGCSYYKMQGNKNVINKLIQTLKSNFNETFILGSITAPVFRKFCLMLFLSKKFSIEIQNVQNPTLLKQHFFYVADWHLNSPYSFMILKKNQCRYLNISSPRQQGQPQVFFNGLSISKIISILTSNILRAF